MQSAIIPFLLSVAGVVGMSATALSASPSVLAPTTIALSTQAQATTVKPELACMRGRVVIGLCGSPDGLLPACGSSYKASCEASGGTPQSCGPDGSACASTFACNDGSELVHDCDEKFMLTCEDKNTGGDFQCTGKCDDGTCCVGECTVGE